MLRGPATIEGRDKVNASNFSLIFEQSDGQVDIHKLRMFVTALWAVYFAGDGPGISIDPIAEGIDKHLVRYIGNVVNTDLGRVMRETDYLMKKWAVGDSKPGCVANFKSPDEIAAKLGKVHVGVPSRFWFVPQGMRFRQAGGALLFDDGWIKLDTEYLAEVKNASLKSPENEEFAQFFTQHYWEVAECHPVFRELFEYAKYVSLAKYLKEQQAPLLWFLLANRDMVITEDSPGVVKAFATESKHIEYLHIEGGVDLGLPTSDNHYVFDRETIDALKKASDTNQSPAGKHDQLSIKRGIIDGGVDSYSVVPPTDVTLSGGTTHGDIFHTDATLYVGSEPGFELTRHYNPDLSTFSTFGGGWHLLVPYRIEPVKGKTVPFKNVVVPARIHVRNLLTGTSEILKFDPEKYGVGGYIPPAPDETITIGVFLMSNGTFRLADKLGNQFRFERDGNLSDMKLAGWYDVSYKYHRASIDRSQIAKYPCILAPVGKETDTVANARFPKLLKLSWFTGAESEMFSLDADAKLSGYRPVNPDRSRFGFLYILSNGAFELNAKNGDKIVFDAGGRFIKATGNVIKKVNRGRYMASLAHDYQGGAFRVQQLRLSDRKLDKTIKRLEYTYREADGKLSSVYDSLGSGVEFAYSQDRVFQTQ
jgi:hypothetical protein